MIVKDEPKEEDAVSIAERRTEQTFITKSCIEDARNSLAAQGVELVSYLMGLRLEYLEMRKEAVSQVGEEAVKLVEESFSTTFNDSTKFKAETKRSLGIMYA